MDARIQTIAKRSAAYLREHLVDILCEHPKAARRQMTRIIRRAIKCHHQALKHAKRQRPKPYEH